MPTSGTMLTPDTMTTLNKQTACPDCGGVKTPNKAGKPYCLPCQAEKIRAGRLRAAAAKAGSSAPPAAASPTTAAASPTTAAASPTTAGRRRIPAGAFVAIQVTQDNGYPQQQIIPLEDLAAAIGNSVVKYLRGKGQTQEKGLIQAAVPALWTDRVRAMVPSDPDSEPIPFHLTDAGRSAQGAPAESSAAPAPKAAPSPKTPAPKPFIADGEGKLSPIQTILWGSAQLRALLSAALENERWQKDGLFVVVPKGGSLTEVSAKRFSAVNAYETVLFTVRKVDISYGDGDVWLTGDHTGHDVRRVFPDGRTAISQSLAEEGCYQ